MFPRAVSSPAEVGLFAESVVLETNVLGRGLAAKVFMGLAPGFPVGVVGTLSLALLALALVVCAGRGGSTPLLVGLTDGGDVML